MLESGSVGWASGAGRVSDASRGLAVTRPWVQHAPRFVPPTSPYALRRQNMSRSRTWNMWVVVGVAGPFVIHLATCRCDEPCPAQAAETSPMKYVKSSEQLVVELYVRSIKESTAFYEKLGFKALRQEPTFVELGWEDSRLFLEQLPGQ